MKLLMLSYSGSFGTNLARLRQAFQINGLARWNKVLDPLAFRFGYGSLCEAIAARVKPAFSRWRTA